MNSKNAGDGSYYLLVLKNPQIFSLHSLTAIKFLKFVHLIQKQLSSYWVIVICEIETIYV